MVLLFFYIFVGFIITENWENFLLKDLRAER